MKKLLSTLFSILLVMTIGACTSKDVLESWWNDTVEPELEEQEIQVNNETPPPIADKVETEPWDEMAAQPDAKPEVLDDQESSWEDQAVAEEVNEAPWAQSTVGLATCLKEKWVKLYWTSWCSHCNRQKEMLWEDGVAALWFIDCDENRSECRDAWVEAYPTWIVDWEKLPWVRQLAFLAQKTWCQQ